MPIHENKSELFVNLLNPTIFYFKQTFNNKLSRFSNNIRLH